MKLYELAADYEAFIAAIEAGEIPEEAIIDTLESIESAIEDKVENIACLLKNLAAEAAAIKVEEDKLAERRKSKEKAHERFKAYLSDMMLKCGKTKFESARNKISFRKSDAVSIDDEEKFLEWAAVEHDEYLTYKSPSINRTAIKKAIESGIKIDGAHIEIRQNIQIK